MFRKYGLLGLLVLMPQTGFSESRLLVQENETLLIQDNQELSVDRWIMQKNSRIHFAPGVTRWAIRATSAEFASGAIIDGRGREGLKGSSPNQEIPAAESCQPGQDGEPGTAGKNGVDGVHIQVEAGIERLADLGIYTNGGDGGSGGYGGPGGPGGRADGCHGKPGGNGGPGGDGGNGGNGGDILFRYWIKADEARVPISNYGVGVTLISDGGTGGAPGLGGKGGKGGKGRYEKRTGNITITRESGENGKSGTRGIGGVNGSEGKILIEAVAVP